jgi:hypothetical protein
MVQQWSSSHRSRATAAAAVPLALLSSCSLQAAQTVCCMHGERQRSILFDQTSSAVLLVCCTKKLATSQQLSGWDPTHEPSCQMLCRFTGVAVDFTTWWTCSVQ